MGFSPPIWPPKYIHTTIFPSVTNLNLIFLRITYIILPRVLLSYRREPTSSIRYGGSRKRSYCICSTILPLHPDRTDRSRHHRPWTRSLQRDFPYLVWRKRICLFLCTHPQKTPSTCLTQHRALLPSLLMAIISSRSSPSPQSTTAGFS